VVDQFQFARLPLIHFGNGKLSLLPRLIRRFGTGIILVTGKNSFLNSVYSERLFDALCKEDINYHHVIIPGEPTPSMIDDSTGLFIHEKIDVVVAIGGGSTMDAGKAISAMMYRNEKVSTFLEGIGNREHPGTKIPFIAVPTTSGTGSEATKNAVISQTGKEGFKKSLRHDNFVPDIALVDPELTLNCPADITAASGMDCFTQLTEAFLSDKACEYTDALCLAGLRAIRDSLVKCYMNGDDKDARTGMAFAALTSGICLANAGLGVVHGFASSIGGLFDIPHGVVCGTLMAPANEVSVRELRKGKKDSRSLQKYAALGRLFLDEEGRQESYYIDGFLAYLGKISEELHMPGLKQYGIREKDIEAICNITEVKNNPVKLDNEALQEILSVRIR